MYDFQTEHWLKGSRELVKMLYGGHSLESAGQSKSATSLGTMEQVMLWELAVFEDLFLITGLINEEIKANKFYCISSELLLLQWPFNQALESGEAKPLYGGSYYMDSPLEMST